MNDQEKDIVIKSINDSKLLIREIQQKLFDEDIDTKEIFNITVSINDSLDEIFIKLHK